MLVLLELTSSLIHHWFFWKVMVIFWHVMSEAKTDILALDFRPGAGCLAKYLNALSAPPRERPGSHRADLGSWQVGMTPNNFPKENRKEREKEKK